MTDGGAARNPQCQTHKQKTRQRHLMEQMVAAGFPSAPTKDMQRTIPAMVSRSSWPETTAQGGEKLDAHLMVSMSQNPRKGPGDRAASEFVVVQSRLPLWKKHYCAVYKIILHNPHHGSPLSYVAGWQRLPLGIWSRLCRLASMVCAACHRYLQRENTGTRT